MQCLRNYIFIPGTRFINVYYIQWYRYSSLHFPVLVATLRSLSCVYTRATLRTVSFVYTRATLRTLLCVNNRATLCTLSCVYNRAKERHAIYLIARFTMSIH